MFDWAEPPPSLLGAFVRYGTRCAAAPLEAIRIESIQPSTHESATYPSTLHYLIGFGSTLRHLVLPNMQGDQVRQLSTVVPNLPAIEVWSVFTCVMTCVPADGGRGLLQLPSA